MTARVAKIVLVLLVLGVAGCDQGTKGWVEHDLGGRPPHTLVRGALDLEYAQNPGVAFNLEQQMPAGARTPLVVVVGLGMISLIGLAIWKRRDRITAESAGYALVLGGAAGNFIDRIARGYVVDFVHVHGWPVFNVADCAIVAGVGLLFLSSLSRSRQTSS